MTHIKRYLIIPTLILVALFLGACEPAPPTSCPPPIESPCDPLPNGVCP